MTRSWGYEMRIMIAIKLLDNLKLLYWGIIGTVEWLTLPFLFLVKISAAALPTCDVYFQQQGGDFIVDKGNIILKRNQKQSGRADEWSEVNHFFMAIAYPAINEPSNVVGTM